MNSSETDGPNPERWLILAILNLSLVIVVASVSSLNLAIPSIQRALDATASELVWINAAYALVFAGLLLPAGAIGDRYGRKGALLVGLTIFVASTLLATFADTPNQLIALRALMGVGAALTMPATLSIITVVFPPEEKAKAIAIWSGFAGAGGALGVLASGILLEQFWWGSVFLVNAPISLLAIVLVMLFVPTSRDSEERPLDPLGSVLSIVGLTALVYGLIEGPERGWADPVVVGAFVASLVFIGAWVKVEMSLKDPMLDPRLFRIRPFSVGSFAVTSSFLVMFGMLFVLTQYLQFTLGYTPLEAAVRTLPFALTMIVVAPNGPNVANRIGAGNTIALGMVVSAVGVAWLGFLGVDTGYGTIAGAVVITAAGMALAFPSATESIVTSLPENKAGVASAMKRHHPRGRRCDWHRLARLAAVVGLPVGLRRRYRWATARGSRGRPRQCRGRSVDRVTGAWSRTSSSSSRSVRRWNATGVPGRCCGDDGLWCRRPALLPAPG